jgi:hypothetical protein
MERCDSPVFNAADLPAATTGAGQFRWISKPLRRQHSQPVAYTRLTGVEDDLILYRYATNHPPAGTPQTAAKVSAMARITPNLTRRLYTNYLRYSQH